MWNMELYFLPIGVYGKSGFPEWRWIWTKSSISVMDHLLGKSKVLCQFLTCSERYLDIGTMPMESVPHPFQKEESI